MPVNRSHGVFVSQNVVKALTQNDINRLYWATSTGSNFRGQQLTKDDFSESLFDTHEIGQKNTKYHTLRPKESPLMNRAACSYASDFRPRPVGDAAENRAFAESLRGVTKNRSAPQLSYETTKESEFRPPRTVEELHGAKQQPSGDRQARTNTLRALGGSQVLLSTSQRQHCGPSEDLASTAPQAHTRSNLTLAGNRASDFWTTSYTRDSLSATGSFSKSAPTSPQAVVEGLNFDWPPKGSRPKAPLTLGLPPNIEM
mmetsp:Transcript_20554/g.52432  ORF Transcript_20554/g.52432 Transcript_20554/m.52432 type:complete len:257 (-) Transcript_20554:75-845(-)